MYGYLEGSDTFSNAGTLVQTMIDEKGRVYARRKEGGTWYDWYQQGAQEDSSSIGQNGWIRFANGLQLHWGQVDQSNSSSDAGTSVTFTKAFSSEPRIFVDTSWGGKYKKTIGLQVFNRSAAGFSVISPSYNGTNLVYDIGVISWFAIGPWR